jgi:hypothetical protein
VGAPRAARSGYALSRAQAASRTGKVALGTIGACRQARQRTGRWVMHSVWGCRTIVEGSPDKKEPHVAFIAAAGLTICNDCNLNVALAGCTKHKDNTRNRRSGNPALVQGVAHRIKKRAK